MNIERQPEFAAADVPLRDDVRKLGAWVGDMLAEQVSPEFLAEVERVRTTAIARRQNGGSMESLAELLAGLSPQHAEQLIRAFSTYFQVVNLAERVHRIRRRRDYQRQGGAPQPEGVHDALLQLKSQGVSLDELRQWLPRIDIEPVFTAHPSEAVRRALLTKEQLMTASLINGLDDHQTPHEKAVDEARFRMALTSAWQTADSSPVRPGVEDEREHVGFYLTEVLYRVVPVFYETLETALRETHGESTELPRLLRFGTWVGGDMDGNPNVDATTVRGTLQAQRAAILRKYQKELGDLATLLSQSDSIVGVLPELRQRIDDYRALVPQAESLSRPRHADQPYRLLNDLMRARLQATRDGAAHGYASPREFADDVDLVLRSLEQNRGVHAGWFAVRRLAWRVRSFGFHLARLDVRQESSVHARAVAAALGDQAWESRGAVERAALLGPHASGEKPLPASQDEGNPRLDAVFAALAEARRIHGADALGAYIISMAHNRADVLTVLALARRGGLVDADGHVPLDIAPLFETIDDLQHGPEVLRDLAADPVYRTHLAARGNVQMVMLGYSDSGKDGGIAASRWGLQRGQVELLDAAKELGIKLTFFHGRGGSISRGGGKTSRALQAAPRGSVDGRLRVTEQGEVIHRKYGIRALALRNLEQTTGAVLRASLRPRPPEPREATWRAIVAELAATSRTHYRALVHERDDFPAYFRAATPIDVIEQLRIGSRPSRRRDGGIANLRAIPWVFAWSQNRSGLTGWYGVGTALQRGIDTHGLDAMAAMARHWPFMAAAIDDVEMLMAKSDIDIFERYSLLAGDAHDAFFPQIGEEFERTRDAILAIKGRDTLLADDYRLRLSIRLRNPYVDPISLLQVDLLRRWRATGREDEALLRALIATVNGIAAGIQNTG